MRHRAPDSGGPPRGKVAVIHYVPQSDDAEANVGIQSFQASGLVTCPAGRTTEVQWSGPVERPRVNTLVARTPGYILSAEVPSAPAAYRLVITTERTEGYPWSTATRTEWGFTFSATTAGEVRQLPLVQVDYGIRTASDGKADRDAELLVTPSHIAGASVAAVRTDRVELSYDDGRTWRRATLSSPARGALTRLHAPAAGCLSLRVHASDARGNTVTQTVIRATGAR
ncbi:hypothetical protein ACFYYH_15630 [Streptomyces sp. NPDC002018]|uniref:hypothetical protein n=1 Tax=Streptomyces sp. NPDC002018 TaxID=3364629 RepID=UPI0036B4A8E0